ncbi:hypothetical protein [Legionella micdadei]|uniref:Secreted protein n=1 Tax=Legionella micdadei TaxID=451 RepID=A0A1G5FGQ2_LEGMI|nr:hypothetical protein [Legionella micdadei]ARG97200.1 hypothetical protein B6N58_05740 [Legionella micdadei]ARH00541.1 hypothetical protein B6V88_08950 [Legionella micdadei]KTD29194.1 hypothetical protein Lmic_1114 [Legionella micdadei]NSL17432.1 hypothetical protein [Legionella micdadei]SCY38455.1 hypothetical protein SAMN02982997_01557 [Legionella micdadei]
MKIKSTVAGIIVAATMSAVGASQAYASICTTCAHCSTCPTWNVPDEFSGTGWHTVPCNTVLQPAATWQQYTSGRYAPPVTGKSVFLGL